MFLEVLPWLGSQHPAVHRLPGSQHPAVDELPGPLSI